MNYLKGILLGLVQGLTEFLPVSSSGHLVLVEKALDIHAPGITFEIFLHVGTLFSVIWVYRERLINIIKSFLLLVKKEERKNFLADSNRRFGFYLIIASIPTALIAFLLRGFVEDAFSSTLFVGIALIFTGVLLLIADLLPTGHKSIEKTSPLDAVLIGTFQGIAIFPGLSRSGATISGALLRKLDKNTAAEFSFLLSIPAILGGAFVEILSLGNGNPTPAMDWLFYLSGIIAAGLAGIFAIKYFIKLLLRDRLLPFTIYCWVIGIVVILLSL